MTTLDDTTAVGLRRRLQGSVLQPGDGGFAEATFLWNAMVERKPALVVQLPRGAGQREDRYMHLLCGPVDVAAINERMVQRGEPQQSALEARVAALESEVAALREDVAALRDQR